MMTFTVGQTYETRSACDHDCIFSFRIHDRSERRVIVTVNGQRVARQVKVIDGVETFMPFGRYSMAPVISADRPAK